MQGLDPEVAVHYLGIDPRTPPVKQPPRRKRIKLEERIIGETTKLKFNAGDFFREEKYAEWIANIVPVKKKK